MAERRLSERNAKIAAMLSDGESLKNFYRFIAQNEYINLHDACQIVIERPDATVCNTLEEWNALGRRVIKGRKSIAYYDHDGYKQFVFDANDTYGDERFQRDILPLKHLLVGLDALNGTSTYEDGRRDYRKIHNGVYTYLERQGELTGDEQYDGLRAEGIAYSLYCKTGFPKLEHIRLHGLPYSYRENAAFVKKLYIRSELIAEEIEEVYAVKQSEVKVIDDTQEETVSDEPVIGTILVEQTEIQEQSDSEQEVPEQGTAISPVYRRYLDVQRLKPQAIVLLQVGDFWEVMGENARTVAQKLGLTLTSREVGLTERVPMCGFPYHVTEVYLEKLLEKHSVILAEEGKEPKHILSHAELYEHDDSQAQEPVSDDQFLGEVLQDNAKGKEEENLAESKYLKETARGYKVVSIAQDKTGRNVAIVQRNNDFTVAIGYDTTDGTWAQGVYDFKDAESANEYRQKYYGKDIDPPEKWYEVFVSRDALIKTYDKSSLMRMPSSNPEYADYTYFVYNNRIKEAVIANYEKSTLFKMPKGKYEGMVYYIPSGMVRKDEDGLRLRLPESFEAHLKTSGSGEKIDLTAEQLMAELAGKSDEDYEGIYRRPSEEAIKKFEKVEKNLRERLPDEMKNKPNWVVVRTRENKETGRLDKYLIDVHTGKFAESDNPETWTDFDTACKYAKEHGGVALAYALDGTDGIACIDLDHCVGKDGKRSALADEVLAKCGKTYAEHSVSGKGIHVFGRTKGADLRSFSKDGDMEYYQDRHFITMTGDGAGYSRLESFDAPEMKSLLERKLERRTEWKNVGKGEAGLTQMDDRELLEKAFSAKNGDTVRRLYNGEDLRHNHSNSDMSLMNYLAFYSGGNVEQMTRIFATSGLYRSDKPASYYEYTAIKAAKDTPHYTPPRASNAAPKSTSGGNGKA